MKTIMEKREDIVFKLFEKIVKENPNADLQTIANKLQEACNNS